ncbi:EexN family lipoprotein [Campylobacter sp. JMF_06 NA1]|uniref:EexN family lipoprotein n=1 Tax=Campylobacter sp. JMF_06 NA1 TaxID=2983823 RepID=UPI0022E9ED83|nr:EexN family lipoprotein [Campylobacter sp. JMF_06 NA1]MDA3078544.1 EexN family lipoprotein [Campylobacter sp. JMF_06 NA1]
MKRILTLSLVAAMGFGLSGCGEQDPRTADYFADNIEIAKARVDECKKMERMSEKTQTDCENAKMAVKRVEARAEAEMSKARTNLVTALSDFQAYYTSQSKFISDIGAMTNVPTPIKLGDKICVEFATKGDKELEIRVNRDDEICKNAFGSLKSGEEEKMYDGVGKIIVR